ncbi:hypothetical protein HDU98_010025 [Podochytrium sp. JEL0797]|nr:hypothetical protein HDU98_010025 [Podochytrium sp. JEL0797]
MTLAEKLGNLEHWPPVSFEGLKAGLEVALKLADESRPLVLILDALDELSLQDDVRTLSWLPAHIPSHVKIILSTAPTSRKDPTFSLLSSLYPSQNSSLFSHLEVPFLTAEEVTQMVERLETRDLRALRPAQKHELLTKCNALRLPLYIRASWTLHARKWSSSTPGEVVSRAVRAETVPGLVEDFFDALEEKLGRCFVGRAVAYVTAARQGVGRRELEDLVSCDEVVMNEVFEEKQGGVRRIPTAYVERLLEELGDCLVMKEVYGVRAIFWSHQQFALVAEDRYLEQGQSRKIHSAFASYWESKYSSDPKQYYDAFGVSKTERRYVLDQSLLISGKPNARRISAIVWHQLAMGPSGFRLASKTLQDISHLGTAVHAGLLWDVLASYRFAMSLETAEVVIVQQLNDYYRFLLEHTEVLLFDPNRLVPVAANLYAGSAVADEARKWILSHSPGLNWIEWVNRPTARGEPLVTLRGTDGGSASDVMMVTGRDTYDERLVLAGVRTFDNQPTVFLYDVEQIEAASVGGGKAKLLGKCYFQDPRGEVIEQGVPLAVAYSRKGDQIAVGARSIVFLDGFDLSIKKVGRDPTLPEGDLITAVAWTAKDGCIVSASDGSQPGRIGLWDAGSLTLLKVIPATMNPRQPVTCSFNMLGFWDEGREHFALLDIDELASDPEGTGHIQYIHNKPHSNPPPDCCARFAMSFRGDYAILAEETGNGYLLIDMHAKRPVARLEMKVDRVRFISISHDGKRVAIVPTDDKVIHIHGITVDSKPAVEEGNLYTYQHLGTILGVDPAVSDGSPISCVFSRSGKTVLTDGEYGSVRVWSVEELGDHAVTKYVSTLAAAYRNVVPIRNSEGGECIGWAVNEGSATVSLSDKRAGVALQANQVGTEKRLRRVGFSRKDLVTGLAAHLTKPVVASVTNNGNLTLLYAEQAFHEKGWTGALKSAFSKKEGVYSVSFNVMRDGGYISPSCIAFLNSESATVNGIAEGSVSEILSFAVGYEDGTVSIWDWNSSTSLAGLVPTVTLKLGVGRVTSIVATNIASSRAVALTVDDGCVLLWDGVSSNVNSVEVLVQPSEVGNNTYISMRAGPKLKNRRSVTSIMSITGLLERNSDHAVAVVFSNTQGQLLATGETDGMITIWNTEAKVKRSLLIHSNDILPAPVTAIAWASDDAAIVSLTEDKRVAIHNTVTGNIVWIHELWMVSPHINCASFANSARDLVVLDHEGGLTSIHLHGDWPTAANADVFSPSTKSSNDSNHPVIRHKAAYPDAPEPEFADFMQWTPELTHRLVEARSIKNSRTAYQWEFSTGSSTHGHVALVRLNEGLPRGAYEVVCNVEVVEEPTVPLKFLCWTTGDSHVVDPELDVVHGFTRLVPLEEQKQLMGKGTVCLRLGFIKTNCRLENCCIDLTRVPGEGEPIAFGDVHFLPVDPVLYRPDYEPSADLADAFDHLSVDFDEFEHAQGRRNSHIGSTHLNEHLVNADFPDLLPVNPRDLDTKHKLASFDSHAGSGSSSMGEVMWEFGQDDSELSDSFPAVQTNFENFDNKKKNKPNRKSMRMSVMESIAGVKTNMSGVVGGILTSAASVLPVGSTPRVKASPEDIAREMQEARNRGLEQARMFEEAEEFRAAQAAKQRDWMARQIEFSQDSQRRAMLMQMQREAASQYRGVRSTGSPEIFDEEDEFDLEGVDEDIKIEARRLMREMLEREMEQDLEEEEVTE